MAAKLAANRNARALALRVLNKFDVRRHDAATILHEIIHQTDRRAQTTDIVFGVIRNRRALDMVITKTGGVRKERIGQKLLNILRIGAYELIFASQTAEYAVVNEAVNLAGSIAGKKQAGFINAVLREITRNIQNPTAKLDEADPKKTLPQSQTTGCLFKNILLPDPKTHPAAHLAAAFSLPEWLVEQFIIDLGPEQTKSICFASSRRPGIYIRPNTLKTSSQKLLEKLTASGVECKILSETPMINIKSRMPIFVLPGFAEGLFTVQDPAAAKVIATLSPKPGQVILDLCAAPGGKTVQMAHMMQNTGTIIATDIDTKRLQKVNDNCQRLGISIVKTVEYDQLPRIISQIPPFDAVLLDVPCSNTAVLARRPEVRLRITSRAIKSLTKTQRRLLQMGAKLIKAGARICYSTCSILKAENEEIVKQFLFANPDFELQHQELVLPVAQCRQYFDHDGGYYAIITKKRPPNPQFS